MDFVNDLFVVASEAILAAGQAILNDFNSEKQLSFKGYRDIVLQTDLEVQAQMVNIIKSHYPSHGIISEEGINSVHPSSIVVWFIDPIDGTHNFSRQQSNLVVSLAVAHHTPMDRTNPQDLILGLLYDPFRDELFSAINGQGAKLNGKPIQVSKVEEYSDIVLSFDWGRHAYQRVTMLDFLATKAIETRAIRVLGSAALAIAWVAAGRLDAFVCTGINTWDIAAANLILREAGGYMSNDRMKEWSFNDNMCMASNNKVHSIFDSLQFRK
jgi:myo-inositol-1(or 4)-monophosphatase